MKIKFLLGFFFFSLMQNTIKASDTLGCYNGYEFEPEIFDRAEVMPSFPGGWPAFHYFIRNNTKQFKNVLDTVTTSEFIVKCFIDTSGTLRQPKILKSNLSSDVLDELCDLLRRMPKWNCAKQRGKPVKCYLVLPFKYIH